MYIPQSRQRNDWPTVFRHAATQKVDLPAVFRARLESALLYPAPGMFRMEKHHGPVHSIDCSPFHRYFTEGDHRVSLNQSPSIRFLVLQTRTTLEKVDKSGLRLDRPVTD